MSERLALLSNIRMLGVFWRGRRHDGCLLYEADDRPAPFPSRG